LCDFDDILEYLGFTAPKIMWLKKNEPENYRRTTKIMLPHDYVNYVLSGRTVHAMERGDSSGMGIFSLESNTFDTDLMHFIDPDLSSKLPSIVDPHSSIGSVNKDVFRKLFPGFTGEYEHDILIAPGCGDNAMSTLAVSSLSAAPEQSAPLILSLGTSGTLSTVSARPLVDPSGGIAPFCDSTGNYLPLICIQNCSLVPEEVRKTFPHLSVADITALAAQEPPGCEGVLLLPYFSEGGERTPNWPAATGCFLGLRPGHLQRPGLLYRAALESVAFALLRGHRLLVDHGLALSDDAQITLVGGGLATWWGDK
jgi:xylulokinase